MLIIASLSLVFQTFVRPLRTSEKHVSPRPAKRRRLGHGRHRRRRLQVRRPRSHLPMGLGRDGPRSCRAERPRSSE
jgi:hypothetical protein